MIINFFEALQENEMKTFYAYTQNPNEETKKAHEVAKNALVEYAKSNGIIK